MDNGPVHCFFCFTRTPATTQVTLGTITFDVCADCRGVLEQTKPDANDDAPPGPVSGNP